MVDSDTVGAKAWREIVFIFTGEGGNTYTLANTADVERTSITEFSLFLSAIDRAAVNQMMNKNATSATVGTVYNLAAAVVLSNQSLKHPSIRSGRYPS